MSRHELLIFPCGGTALEALDCVPESTDVLGFIDDNSDLHGVDPHGNAVFGRDALTTFADAQVVAVPGSPTSFRRRAEIIASLGVATSRWGSLIHPRATVSRYATLGHNVVVMAGVVISANARIGNHVCILPNSVIHHDTAIGDYCLVGAGVLVAGRVQIGENCYIGSGSRIRNDLSIGAGTLVGMGSNVVRSIESNRTVFGNPASEKT